MGDGEATLSRTGGPFGTGSNRQDRQDRATQAVVRSRLHQRRGRRSERRHAEQIRAIVDLRAGYVELLSATMTPGLLLHIIDAIDHADAELDGLDPEHRIPRAELVTHPEGVTMPFLRRRTTPLQQALAALAKAERARSASSVANGLAALANVGRRPAGNGAGQSGVVTGSGLRVLRPSATVGAARAPVRT